MIFNELVKRECLIALEPKMKDDVIRDFIHFLREQFVK